MKECFRPKRRGLVATGLLLGSFVVSLASCHERPKPFVIADFVARRPTTALVMPAVFIPEEAKSPPIDVRSRRYQAIVLDRGEAENAIYRGLELGTCENLQRRGIATVAPQKLAKDLVAMRGTRQIDWGKLASTYRAEAIVFITLRQWDPGSSFIGAESAIDPQRSILRQTSRRTTVRLRVRVEVFHIGRRELMWADSNFPTAIQLPGIEHRRGVATLMGKAVDSAFDTMPIEKSNKFN